MFKLCRTWNALFAAVVCACSFFIAQIDFSIDFVLLSLGVFFLLAFANAHNDIVDLEIDKINRPNRPLPSGKLSLRTAYVVAFACLFFAIILGFISDFKFGILFIAVGVLCFEYNKYLKGLPLVGNFTVALLTTTPIIAVIIFEPSGFVWLAMLAYFAFMFTFAREIIKDIEDMEGDKTLGLKTFPVLFGIKPSLVVFFLWLAISSLATIPWTFDFIFIKITVPIIAFYAIFAYFKKWRLLQFFIKLTMLAGLILYIISHV